MANNKMLIDASHPEETRVVVLRGNRVEEFDFESASKKPLRGNIYLAKVTRVEPSLQAAFVEYGGNRHGFLAFSEIHPDYYQIPVADRQALLEEEARAEAEETEEEQRPQRRSRRFRRDRDRGNREKRRSDRDETISEPAGLGEQPIVEGAPIEEHAQAHAQDVPAAQEGAAVAEAPAAAEPGHAHETVHADHEHAGRTEQADEAQPVAAQHDAETPVSVAAPIEAIAEGAPASNEIAGRAEGAPEEFAGATDESATPATQEARAPNGDDEAEADDEETEGEEDEPVEQLGGDAMEEMPVRRSRPRRQYKIQEVIKRRQVLLVQVVKEERGNKGAALTTYLSLAGRYSVLMPNTARGGGISRKITDAQDRRRLKEIVQELEVPEGMGIILRTAGAARTTGEVKRDFEYLLRMWETVREVTLQSTAPTLVYEEGSLIKRTIRDLYNKDIEEITVAGEEGFKEAQNFMRLLLPSNVDSVKQWSEPQALFARYGVEQQLDAMYSNHVTLKSGGYIVIGQTEALVAIDVNSGRSTREHNIEDTALRTNLEAAEEVARQLRLRDLAGLIVVDFIDMEEHRNNRSVERRMKEALKNDRARIQVGHISHFGLLEMSRQRMRTGVLEGSTVPCPHCTGSGMVRSTSSIALHVLRVLEDALIRSATHNITVRTRTPVALYILNQKRANLHEIETRFGVTVTVVADDTLTGAVYHALERGELALAQAEYKPRSQVRIDSIAPEPGEDSEIEADAESDADAEAEGGEDRAEGNGDENGDDRGRRRRRRRRRGKGDRDFAPYQASDADQPPDAGLAVMAQVHGVLPVQGGEADGSDAEETNATEAGVNGDDAQSENGFDPRRRRRRGRGRGRGERGDRERGPRQVDRFEREGAQSDDFSAPVADGAETVHAHEAEHRASPEPVQDAPAPLTAERETFVAPPPPAIVAEAPTALVAEPEKPAIPEPPRAVDAPLPEAAVDPAKPKRAGWWQRAKASLGG